jgi:hypothetical protein
MGSDPVRNFLMTLGLPITALTGLQKQFTDEEMQRAGQPK